MHIHPALLILWAALAVALLAVVIYRATLTQHETDQLFLNDDGTCCKNHEEHDRIMARVNRVRPLYQGLWGATIVMTFVMVGVYAFQIIPRL